MTKKANTNPGVRQRMDGIRYNKSVITNNSDSLILKYALFLGIIAFCIYANTLQNGYVYDDADAIKNNVLVRKGVSAIPEILSTPYHEGVDKGMVSNVNDLYRPLSLVMFAAEYQLFRDNPMPGHLINVLLYAGCVVLFFLFLFHLFQKKRPALAFIGALLFSLHPIHTEIVANIKSRDELLCFFFGFLSLNVFMKYLDSNNIKQLIGGLLFYFLSLFSKETSITFLAVIPLIFFFYRNENRKRSVYISLFCLIPTLLYLGIRFYVLITHHAYNPLSVAFYENALIAAPSFASRLATEILILGYYIKLLIMPYPLICDYGYNAIPFAGFSNWGVWVSLITYICLIFFGVFRSVKKRSDPLAFGILFFLITTALFSNILFLLQSEMAERFMFFPSAGFCIMAAFFIEHLVSKSAIPEIAGIKNIKVLLVIIPVAIIFIIITVDRNTDWKDNITLFRTDSKKSPNNSRLYYFAANAKIELTKTKGIDDAAKQHLLKEGIIDYKKSIAIYPDFFETQDNLALAFVDAKQLDSAEVHAEKAIAIMPNYDSSWNILANIYIDKQEFPEAIALCKKASIMNPANPYYPGNIGVCNIYTNHPDSAIYYFRKAINIDPANEQAIRCIAALYNATGQKDSAKKYETIAKKSDPDFDVDTSPLPRYGK